MPRHMCYPSSQLTVRYLTRKVEDSSVVIARPVKFGGSVEKVVSLYILRSLAWQTSDNVPVRRTYIVPLYGPHPVLSTRRHVFPPLAMAA